MVILYVKQDFLRSNQPRSYICYNATIVKTLISRGPNKDIFDTFAKFLLQQTLPFMTAGETRANFAMVNKWRYLIHLMQANTGQNIRLVISNPVGAVYSKCLKSTQNYYTEYYKQFRSLYFTTDVRYAHVLQ